MGKFAIVLVLGLLTLPVIGCSDEEVVNGTTPSNSGSGAAAVTDVPIVTPSATTATTQTPAPTGSDVPTLTPWPSPTSVESWTEFVDQVTGFALPVPTGTTHSERIIDLTPEDSSDALEQRSISFTRSDGVGILGFGSVPNLEQIGLEEWIRTNPGWPGEPEAVMIAGEPGFRFNINVLGEPDDTVYFLHQTSVFSISGNVFGSPEGHQPPALTQQDFEYVLLNCRFDP
jgi:hypothetical protein